MPFSLVHSVGVVVTGEFVGVGVVTEGFVREVLVTGAVVRGGVVTGGVVGGGVVTGGVVGRGVVTCGFVGADVGEGPIGIVHVEACGGEHVLRLIRLDESHPLLRK